MNNYPIATILGGGGFIGRYLVRNLTKKNFRCIIPTRNPFTKGYLKTQAPPGAIEFIKFVKFLKPRSKTFFLYPILGTVILLFKNCLLYTSPSPRD